MICSVYVFAFFCESIHMIPFLILAFFPFYQQLRMPAWVVVLICVVSQFMQSAFYLYQILHHQSLRPTDYVFAVFCFLIYVTCIKADFWKLLYLYIFVFDYIIFARGVAFFLEACFTTDPNWDFYSLHTMLLIMVVFIVSLPFVLRFLMKTKDRVFEADDPDFWKKIWLLPFLTTLMICLYTPAVTRDLIFHFSFVSSRLFLLLSMLISYWVVLDAMDSIRHQTELTEQTSRQEMMLAMQQTQYQQLTRHIASTREARHDLRQHLNIIDQYLQNGDQEALNDYISQYRKYLPPDTQHTYCKNYAVNTIVCYYAEEARREQIAFEVDLRIPEKLSVPEPELCAVIGNLLENALDACRDVRKPKPFIHVRMKEEDNQLILAIDNTCVKEPAEQDERFLSSKHEGFGTGTSSVQNTAERYHGMAQFRCVNGVFYASVLLYGNEKTPQ